jgi:hypothetical protein
MPAVIEVIDRHGRRRRLRPGEVPADGETVHIPMQFMDHGGFHPYFSDGTPDHTSPHRPGWRFADTTDAARLAADEAYEARRERMHYANRRRQDGTGDPGATARNLDQLRALADAAYEAKCKRLQEGWRNRHD